MKSGPCDCQSAGLSKQKLASSIIPAPQAKGGPAVPKQDEGGFLLLCKPSSAHEICCNGWRRREYAGIDTQSRHFVILDCCRSMDL